ncbi:MULTISPECIES: hypothetical protein [unclassified Neisseria]|uniref:hypothetical protein n=1 Tax=unclassified Neisseria TaxID=2623750 RepID=UPI0010726444|nr:MULTISPECIES: hypothetical protein [unclassified Neisseria]MBF0803821.1 hypothetical protein [Neisseria sp. 19428wB4_WF04]TFU43489.1 hypothetical protein E4T99_05545 [Neisseria sp. WF04]
MYMADPLHFRYGADSVAASAADKIVLFGLGRSNAVAEMKRVRDSETRQNDTALVGPASKGDFICR